MTERTPARQRSSCVRAGPRPTAGMPWAASPTPWRASCSTPQSCSSSIGCGPAPTRRPRQTAWRPSWCAARGSRWSREPSRSTTRSATTPRIRSSSSAPGSTPGRGACASWRVPSSSRSTTPPRSGTSSGGSSGSTRRPARRRRAGRPIHRRPRRPLDGAGFDRNAPTTWVWEGVVPYLDPGEVQATVARSHSSRRRAAGSSSTTRPAR